MATRGIIFSFLCFSVLIAGCKSVPAPEEEGVATRGWESPAEGMDNPGTTREEMESLRTANRRLMEQVATLADRADQLEPQNVEPAPEAAAAKAVDPVHEAPASPETGPSAGDLRDVLRQEGINDLEISTNPDGHVVITLPGAICFASGKAEVMVTGRKRLDIIGDIVANQFPGVDLRVEGHTDSDPIRKSNWGTNQKLSEARARAVAEYLVRSTPLGWDRVESHGYGDTRPIAENTTRDGKARNRRIEILLID
jgi:flagellar motor protein MotB